MLLGLISSIKSSCNSFNWILFRFVVCCSWSWSYRHPDTIFQYPDSFISIWIHALGIRIPSVQQPLSVSECSLEHSNWISDIWMLPSCIRIPSASSARFFFQRIRMPWFAFEYSIQASECLFMHSDTPAQKFKINFQQVKIVLFSIKIVYFCLLLKIILV